MGVVASDEPDTVSAARFTTNARVGAPVIVSKEAALDRLRAVVANSGCSNVGDGVRGLETAAAMQAAAAGELGVEPEQVAVASTGVIGTELPRERVVSGVRAACGALGPDADDFSQAILTSDAGPKRACLEVALPAGTVRLAAQAKGAGMISPRYATMFCFVQTDAALDAADASTSSPASASSAPSTASASTASSRRATRSFVQANGASGVRVEPESADELALGEALDALLRQLALEIVARRRGRAPGRPRGRDRRPEQRRAGRARGGQLAARQVGALRRRPQLRPHPAGRGPGLAARRPRSSSTSRSRATRWSRPATSWSPRPPELVQGEEVEYALTLPGEGGETEVFFSDLSPDYVNFNAEYTS